MKVVILSFVVISVILNVFFQLVAIAQDAGDTSIAFAEQMNQQLRCTYDNIPLSECETSDLTTSDLEAELERIRSMSTEYSQEFDSIEDINASNQSILLI